MLKKVGISMFLLILVLFAIVVTRTMLVNSIGSDEKINQNILISSEFNNESAIKHLSQAVSYKTISTLEDDNQTNAEQFKAFHKFLHGSYPLVFEKLSLKNIGKFGILLKWKGTNDAIKPILLMAHQDVVPIAEGTEQDWVHKPFSGDIDKDFVWGRGSLDDKASLIAILESAEKLLKEKFKPQRSIYFFFGDNEEIGGASAIKAAKYLKEQGITFDYLIDEGGWISTDQKAYISIAEKGYLDVDLFTKAKGGHSSMPSEKTAIGKISTAVSKLEQNKFPKTFVEAHQLKIDALNAELDFTQKMIAKNMWLFKPVLFYTPIKDLFLESQTRTTTAPTIFHAGVKSNVLPAEAKATINFRILPGETTETVIQRVKKIIDDDSVEVIPGIGWDPSPLTSINSDGYRLINKLVHQIVSPDVTIVPNLLMGATDANRLSSVSDNQYRFLCAHFDKTDFSRYHGTNERLSKANLLQMMQFYYQLMRLS